MEEEIIFVCPNVVDNILSSMFLKQKFYLVLK